MNIKAFKTSAFIFISVFFLAACCTRPGDAAFSPGPGTGPAIEGNKAEARENNESGKEERKIPDITGDKEHVTGNGEKDGNHNKHILYFMPTDSELAEITVPDDMTVQVSNKYSILARDESTYVFTCSSYWGKDTDQFFEDIADLNSYIDNPDFPNAAVSDAPEMEIDGHRTIVKSVSFLYKNTVKCSVHYAVTDIKDGVFVVALNATAPGDGEEKIKEILNGIRFIRE